MKFPSTLCWTGALMATSTVTITTTSRFVSSFSPLTISRPIEASIRAETLSSPVSIARNSVLSSSSSSLVLSTFNSKSQFQSRRLISSRLYQSAVIDDEVMQEQDRPSISNTDNDGKILESTVSSPVSPPPLSTSTTSSRVGKPIARGKIVRVFPGGLLAVRVDEEITGDHIAAAATSTSNDDDDDITDGILLQQQQQQEEHPSSPLNPNNNRPTANNNNNSLGGDLMGRQVIFGDDSQLSGVVVVHRPPVIFVYMDNTSSDLAKTTMSTLEGTVTVMDNFYSVNIPETGIQHVDGFGRSIEEGSDLPTRENSRQPTTTTSASSRAIFEPIPQVKDIALINKPLVTGVTMFDALAPIGMGQNMLMIGHDADDMRRYVIGDMLKIQCTTGTTKCVYAATGDITSQKTVSNLLESTGLSDDVILVSSQSSGNGGNCNSNDIATVDEGSAAAEATVVAATACAIGESFARQDGEDVLVIIDNIDQHKMLWDTTTRVLVDVFGVDSVVKGDRDGGASSEMRAFFSSLIQRSAQFNAKRGGGSVTLVLLQTIPSTADDGDDDSAVFTMDDFEGAPDKIRERLDLLVKKNIPLTASTLRKIQIPVPSAEEGRRRLSLQHVDDLISMSDGQIWLDERLEQSGRQPPFDFQRSITRVGIGADTNSRADAAAMRRVVEGLRLDLSQAESMDGADVATNASKKQMRNAAAWLLAMHQPSATGARRLSESCVALLAASTGALNDSIDNGVTAGSTEGTELMRNLLDHVTKSIPEAMEEIDTTQDFSDATKATIVDTIQSYFDSS